jgi:hypothetical protein
VGEHSLSLDFESWVEIVAPRRLAREKGSLMGCRARHMWREYSFIRLLRVLPHVTESSIVVERQEDWFCCSWETIGRRIITISS